MIRHAPQAAACPVGPVPVAVIVPSLRAFLVFPVGGPRLLAARFLPAAVTAVFVAPVTMTADPEHPATVDPPAKPLTQWFFMGPHGGVFGGPEPPRRSMASVVLSTEDVRLVFMGPGETSRHTAFSVFGWRTPVYSRDGISGVGTTGNVVKMRLAASSSMATEVNSPSPGEVQRTDPRKSDVSAEGNVWSISQAVCPLASRGMETASSSTPSFLKSHRSSAGLDSRLWSATPAVIPPSWRRTGKRASLTGGPAPTPATPRAGRRNRSSPPLGPSETTFSDPLTTFYRPCVEIVSTPRGSIAGERSERRQR